jgi:polyisoprenoid-binding protein YceI
MEKKNSCVTSVCKFERAEGLWLLYMVTMRLAMFSLFVSAVFPSLSRAQVAVFEITPAESSVKFDVEASVAIKGVFDKWGATLTFASPEVETAVLDIKI